MFKKPRSPQTSIIGCKHLQTCTAPGCPTNPGCPENYCIDQGGTVTYAMLDAGKPSKLKCMFY